MRGNILGVFFTILSGVLIALIVIAYGRSDRIAPEFRFSALDMVYDSETKDDELKVGVNAYDTRDGDLTSRIVVEKVVLNREAETAVVYYAVADHSGNVTKQSRVFPANIMDIDSNGDSSEKMEDGMHPKLSFEDATSATSASTADTETEQEAETLPEVAVIVHVPALMAVTSPASLTVATASSLEAQDTAPPAGVVVAVICSVSPVFSVREFTSSEIAVTVYSAAYNAA